MIIINTYVTYLDKLSHGKRKLAAWETTHRMAKVNSPHGVNNIPVRRCTSAIARGILADMIIINTCVTYHRTTVS